MLTFIANINCVKASTKTNYYDFYLVKERVQYPNMATKDKYFYLGTWSVFSFVSKGGGGVRGDIYSVLKLELKRTSPLHIIEYTFIVLALLKGP